MRKIFLIGMLLCFTVVTPAKAQYLDDLGFNEEMQEQIQQKVEEFNNYLQCLAGRGNLSRDAKMECYDHALKLLLGEGKSYTVVVPSLQGLVEERRDGVTMSCLITAYKKSKRTQIPMTSYLKHLIKRSENPDYQYSSIELETVDVVVLDMFSNIGDGKIMVWGTVFQHYVGDGKDDRRIYYDDITVKRICLYLYREDGSLPEEKIILLGDMECDDEL